jgi:hypothetical protein
VGVQLPQVIGDPAGMRALATALRSTAAQIEGVDAAVYGKAGCLSFTGPAATRIASEVRGWHGSISGVVTSLQGAAALLERSASDVEAEQIARARLQAKLDEEAREPR